MKVAICIPCHGDPKAEFAISLARLMKATAKAGVEADVAMARCSVLVEGRTRLVEMARSGGATHILWADADHSFRPDSLLRLLARDLDVVGCNYPRRDTRAVPVAVELASAFPVFTTQEKAEAGEVEEVSSLGFGLCLMRMSVIGALEPPLFVTTSLPNGSFLGEDVNFFKAVREAGFKVHVDHAVSGGLGHVYEFVLTNKHSADRNQSLIRAMGSRNADTVLPAAGAQ